MCEEGDSLTRGKGKTDPLKHGYSPAGAAERRARPQTELLGTTLRLELEADSFGCGEFSWGENGEGGTKRGGKLGEEGRGGV